MLFRRIDGNGINRQGPMYMALMVDRRHIGLTPRTDTVEGRQIPLAPQERAPEGSPRCRYGRRCGVIRLQGRV
jgi:hypothetical protein